MPVYMRGLSDSPKEKETELLPMVPSIFPAHKHEFCGHDPRPHRGKRLHLT